MHTIQNFITVIQFIAQISQNQIISIATLPPINCKIQALTSLFSLHIINKYIDMHKPYVNLLEEVWLSFLCY